MSCRYCDRVKPPWDEPGWGIWYEYTGSYKGGTLVAADHQCPECTQDLEECE